MRVCGACGKRLPRQTGAGRKRQCCDNDRCERVFHSGRARTRCARCSGSIPLGRAYQIMAICMSCFLNIQTIVARPP